MSESYSAGDLAAAKEQASAALTPQTGTGPDAGVLRSAVVGAAPAAIDVDQLHATIAAMQAQIAQLQAAKTAAAGPPVVEAANVLADAVGKHVNPASSADHAALARLADDVKDAASNAVKSGSGQQVTQISGKIATALEATHPGPGDHHWYQVALDWAKVHLPQAASELQAPPPAVSGTVVQGSVTG